MRTITEVVLWLIVGALFVLAVTHARGFSTAVSTVGDEGNKILGTLSGQNQSGGT